MISYIVELYVHYSQIRFPCTVNTSTLEKSKVYDELSTYHLRSKLVNDKMLKAKNEAQCSPYEVSRGEKNIRTTIKTCFWNIPQFSLCWTGGKKGGKFQNPEKIVILKVLLISFSFLRVETLFSILYSWLHLHCAQNSNKCNNVRKTQTTLVVHIDSDNNKIYSRTFRCLFACTIKYITLDKASFRRSHKTYEKDKEKEVCVSPNKLNFIFDWILQLRKY